LKFKVADPDRIGIAQIARLVPRVPDFADLVIMRDARTSTGYGLPVKVNGTPSKLLLDTGAGGILISK
jgi:hypothetical protein